MRDFVILGSSSLSTPSHHHYHRHRPSTKPYGSSLSNATNLSPSKPSSPRIPSLHSPSPPRTTPSRILLKCDADFASKLAGDSKLEDFSMIVESVTLSGENSAKFGAALSAELLAKGILTALRQGKVRSVTETLRKVQKLRVAPLKLVGGPAMELLGVECRRIMKCGEVEEVVELLEVLAGFRCPIKELLKPADMIRVCVDKRKPELAIRYACILPHGHILFCTIFQEFGKKRDLVSALTAYEASKPKLIIPNMYIFRTIIDVCGLCGDYMKSRFIFEELLNEKIIPNIYVFNSLMNVNAHDLSYILQVYKNMQNLGVMADMATYNILLKACCLAGRVNFAQDIYREVKHLESTGMLKLDVFTYSTIVKVFADAKLWQMALHIKDDMLSAGVTPNTIAWSSLINACANVGLVEQSIQLFEEMLQAGCEPNSQCCNILLHACVEACQYDRAFRLFQSWKGSRVVEPTSGDFSDNLFRDSSAESADKKCGTSMENFVSNSHHLNFTKRFPFRPTTATYNILMKACGTDYFRAKALMDEMKAVGLCPNHISWSILIDICGGLGNVEGVIQILRNMLGAGVQPDVITYTTAIKVCVEGENLKLAFSLFEEMKGYQIRPNLVTYNTLLRARTRYGSLHEVQQCLSIYQDMRKAGYKSNDYYLEALVEEWCEGVIQDNNLNQRECKSCNKKNLGRPESILLEKVATHLEKNKAERLAIDLQGLTKVEARIVVLAVLRMIKENYHTHGCSVRDDILIILGVSKELVTNQEKHNFSVVKNAMIKLLRDELGLEVLSAGPRSALHRKTYIECPHEPDSESEESTGRNSLPAEVDGSTRRPAVIQRLTVPRKSLHRWLQRSVSSI